MADKKIRELSTTVTTANDADYLAVDGTGGTDATKKILVNSFESQMRNGLSDAELAILNGATVSTAELNKLTGLTASTGELNILNGATISVTELNKLDNFTGTYLDLNYAKDLRATGVTDTEFDYLDGVTSQLSGLDQALEANSRTTTAASYEVSEAGVYSFNTASNAINVTIPITTGLNAGSPMLIVNTAGTNNVVITCSALDMFVLLTGSATQVTGTTLTLRSQSSCVWIVPASSSSGVLLILGGYDVTIS